MRVSYAMACIINQEARHQGRLRFALCSAALALLTCACSALSPSVDPAGPRPNAPPYPVLLTEEESRREATLTAWSAFTRGQGIQDAPAPELQPVTATIRALPQMDAPLYMPKVGEGLPMTENETRESLRRLIASATLLIGADPKQLSLVQRTDLADGTKRARYEQRPFRFPLRNGYGVLEITFAPDRRILQMTSTCIPEVERLQRAGTGIRPDPELTAEKVVSRVVGLTFRYTDATGKQQSETVAKSDPVQVRELVVYPRLRASDPSVLEFHLAWEITIGGDATARALYIDVRTGETL